MLNVKIGFKFRDSRLLLTLEHKLTGIVGDSAKGKSTMAFMCKNLNKREVTVDIKGANGYELGVLPDDLDFNEMEQYLIGLGKKIVLVDEDLFYYFKYKRICEAVESNKKALFVFIGREKLQYLCFDLDAMKHGVSNGKGVIVYKKVVQPELPVSTERKIDHCVIEDSGKAMRWFDLLFNGHVKIATSNGNDNFYNAAKQAMVKNTGSTFLLILDTISYGAYVDYYISLVREFGHMAVVIKNYKCWEHLILKTNMFKHSFVNYNELCGVHEEAYYEDLLRKVSNSRYGTIKHDGGELPGCYYKPCCCMTGKWKNDCTFGLQTGIENDKFIDLLRGTEFEDLLKIAKRIK